MAITRAQQARQMLKTAGAVEQDGVLNYIKNSESVTVPKEFKARSNAPATKLAYITAAEAKMLKKKKPGTPHKGPKGIPSYDSFGSIDASGKDTGRAGEDVSSAERGDFRGFEGSRNLPPGVQPKPSKEAQALRNQFIVAGGGQRVNPRFFDSRNTISPQELALAKASNPRLFRKIRGGGLGSFISGGGFFGNLIRGLGQRFGLGKRFDQPTYDMRQFSGINPTFQDDLGNPLLEQLAEEEDENKIPIVIDDDMSLIPRKNLNDYEGVTPFQKDVIEDKNYDEQLGDIRDIMAKNIAYDERLGFINLNTGKPVDTAMKGARQVKAFNTKEDLLGIGAAKDSFFDTLTPEGKALEKFRKSAVGFKKAEANTANTPQAALNFMLDKPGLYGDIIENKDFIQDAINKGFLADEKDYTDQLPLGKAVDLADGGIIGGGIMDAAGRQNYFLGKLVKKAKRAVKKIVKSPVGKLGLLAAGGFGLNKMFPFIEAGKLTGAGKLFGGGVLSLAPFIFGNQEEENQQDLASLGSVGGNIDPRAYTDPYGVLFRAFRAEGGSMKEPVAKRTMPLLDMGGQEMDLRAEGGFVPIGRMEKADDVPARLSKNEFVFTADAVRNAGDGDVDKGAEVMYNMMKNLEAGGDVSEESQGLEGARNMFQTSKRLEEVL